MWFLIHTILKVGRSDESMKQLERRWWNWMKWEKANGIFMLEVKWNEVAQLCPTRCDPVDFSLPGFSVHGILQASILEWVAISFLAPKYNINIHFSILNFYDFCKVTELKIFFCFLWVYLMQLEGTKYFRRKNLFPTI